MNYVKKIPGGSGDDLPSLPKQFPDVDLKKNNNPNQQS